MKEPTIIQNSSVLFTVHHKTLYIYNVYTADKIFYMHLIQGCPILFSSSSECLIQKGIIMQRNLVYTNNKKIFSLTFDRIVQRRCVELLRRGLRMEQCFRHLTPVRSSSWANVCERPPEARGRYVPSQNLEGIRQCVVVYVSLLKG